MNYNTGVKDGGVKDLGVESIDQILEKIKKAINSDIKEMRPQPDDEDDLDASHDVLELTNVISRSKIEDLDLVSRHVQQFTRKLTLLMQGNYVVSEKEIREIFKETLRPYLKSWLNNNIKDIVKEVLESEVKKLLEKII